jgi:7-cyano-7-deazaguanine tRNA-ribosyltransferase
MSAWQEGRRDDPEPCREQDVGLFEVTNRDGRARLGRLHTSHGILETPALLPVINPNIRTIEPREMWDRYGISALITNSYIIWKHEHLKEQAIKDGVHSLIDFPGVIMTDSGTFQAYIYGDVEVGVEEIVEFQKSIGVDIATMLDVFTRPDMTEEEVKGAVLETDSRALISIESAGNTMINGPIQGGLFKELRTLSAQKMAKHDFSIHPIGGIVPVMEKHMYKDYAKIMLSSLPYLPPNRPVHMFGCGHPMLFPMSIALGADLFDSAAYALFAKDGRLLAPWGTEKLVNLVDWPVTMPCIAYTSPEEVRNLDPAEQVKVLARYNLEVTLTELSRCKQAIRDGTIWRLAEKRSHQHPALREAFLWITTSPNRAGLAVIDLEELVITDRAAARDRDSNRGSWEYSWDWIVSAQESPKKGGVSWGGEDTYFRPHIIEARRQLASRWRAPEPVGNGSGDVLIFHGRPGPWRERCSDLMTRLTHHAEGMEVMILTPLGLLPYSMEDLNPFSHVTGPEWIWRRRPDLSWMRRELERFELGDRRIILCDLEGDGIQARCMDALVEAGVIKSITDEDASEIPLDPEGRIIATNKVRCRHVSDKMTVLLNVEYELARELMQDSTFVINRHGRIKNAMSSSGKHIVSPRLTDGGISLTDDGAMELHSHRSRECPSKFEITQAWNYIGEGPAWVVVDDDAEPFVRKGRNVFHGFVLATDPWITPGRTCLIVNKKGHLLGHGISNCNSEEFATFKKGIAIKTRGGLRETD